MMLQTTIGAILRDEIDVTDEGYNIYVIRDIEHVLYVGRSLDITKRITDHISPTSRIMADRIGEFVWLNAPASLNWQVDLFTPEECRPLFTIPIVHIDDVSAEWAAIQHYRPCLNIVINFNPTPIPAHIKRPKLEVGLTDNLY